jgi:hypothetical protein
MQRRTQSRYPTRHAKRAKACCPQERTAPLSPLTMAQMDDESAQELWLAVLDRARLDTSSTDPEVRAEARAFFAGSVDLMYICDLLGLEADYLTACIHKEGWI